MNLVVNGSTWVLAFLPLALLLFLLLALRWGVSHAAPLAWLLAIIVALAAFGMSMHGIGAMTAKGIWKGIGICWIIWPAILIYEVSQEADAFSPLRSGMTRLLPHPLVQVLALGWAFDGFLQGITGFGAPVAVCAPLLIGIGVRPIPAVAIALVGQAWNNTFGTLAVAWLGLTETVPMSHALTLETALFASIFVWIVNFVGLVLVCWLYGRLKGIRDGLPVILIMSLVQGGLTLVLAQIAPVTSGFIAGIVGLAAIFAVGRLPIYRRSAVRDPRLFRNVDTESTTTPDTGGTAASAPSAPSMSLNSSFIPYYALVVVTLVVLLVPAIDNPASAIQFGPSFPSLLTALGVSTAASHSTVSIFTQPGTFLFVGAFVGFAAYAAMGQIHKGGWGRTWARTAKKATPSSLAVVALLAMAEVMAGGGQTKILAIGTANVTGDFYAFLAPLVGMLGCFMTGSNLASNLIFGNYQHATAHAAHLNQAPILASQTAGAADGAMVAPPKVLLGTTTAGILGQEGDVMRITFTIAIPIAIVIGIISLIFA
jgi:lactate permease